MAGILRGDVVWADLDPTMGREQSGKRPVLVLSHDVFNERSGTVIALALSSQTQKAEFPLTYELDVAWLPKRSWVKISQVRTLRGRARTSSHFRCVGNNSVVPCRQDFVRDGIHARHLVDGDRDARWVVPFHQRGADA